MKEFGTYLRIAAIYWRNSVSRIAIFRVSALIGIAYSLIYLAANYLTLKVYFAGGTSLGGWTESEMLILVGSFQLIVALNECLFLWAQDSLPNDVVDGNIDFYLLKPVNPLFLISVKELYIPGLVNLPFPVLMIATGLYGTGIVPGLTEIFFFLAAICVGVLFQFLITQLILNLTFWIDNFTSAALAADELIKFGSRPKGIFSMPIKIVMGYVFPVLTVFNLPAEVLRGSATWPVALGSLVATLLLLLLVRAQWQRGIKRYQGASC